MNQCFMSFSLANLFIVYHIMSSSIMKLYFCHNLQHYHVFSIVVTVDAESKTETVNILHSVHQQD